MLFVQLYSDAARVAKVNGRTMHPVYLVPVHVNAQEFAEMFPHCVVGYLPQITRPARCKSDDQWRWHRAEVITRALGAMFQGVKDASHEAVTMVDAAGTELAVRFALHSVVADMQEMCDLAGVMRNASPWYFVKFTKKSAFQDVFTDGHRRRDEASMIDIWDKVRPESKLPKGKKAELANENGVRRTSAPLFLAGWWQNQFQYGDAWRLLYPDPMHVEDLGTTKRLLSESTPKYFEDEYPTEAKAKLLKLVQNMEFICHHAYWRGRYIPHGDTFLQKAQDTHKIMASEFRMVSQYIMFALLGLEEDNTLAKIFHQWADLQQEMHRRNRPPGYTNNDIKGIKERQKVFLDNLKEHLAQAQASGWALLKTHAMCQMPHAITQMGATIWGNANLAESCHKVNAHAPYQATNGQTKTVLHQAARAWERREVVSQLAVRLGVRDPIRPPSSRMTMKRRALKEKKNVLQLANVMWRISEGLPPAAADYPFVGKLLTALKRYVTRCGDGCVMPNSINVVKGGAVCAQLAHHPQGFKGAVIESVYATPDFYHRERYTNVAIRSDDDSIVWGTVCLMFYAPIRPGAGQEELAFVRYFETTSDPPPPFPGVQRLRRPQTPAFEVIPFSCVIRTEDILPDPTGIDTSNIKAIPKFFFVNPNTWSREPRWSDSWDDAWDSDEDE